MAVQERVDRLQETPASGDAIRFIGNATVLLTFGDLTILTDPNFVHRGVEVPIGFGLTTTRLTDPALEIDELPPLDLVLLSHDHGDHFDALAEARLDRSIPIATTPSASRSLAQRGFSAVRGLETWTSTELTGGRTRARITALPAQHAAGPVAAVMPEVMGSLLELFREAADEEPALRIYVTGDTVIFDGLAEIAERFPRIDLALLHLGGARVMGLQGSMDAGQGVQLLDLVRPRTAVPIHYNDYEAFKSPLAEFVARVKGSGWEGRVSYLLPGDRFLLQAPT
ncbi:MAG: MBL fold metallo-hydrolase [Candidatus Limnocylindria bacterium]